MVTGTIPKVSRLKSSNVYDFVMRQGLPDVSEGTMTDTFKVILAKKVQITFPTASIVRDPPESSKDKYRSGLVLFSMQSTSSSRDGPRWATLLRRGSICWQ